MRDDPETDRKNHTDKNGYIPSEDGYTGNRPKDTPYYPPHNSSGINVVVKFSYGGGGYIPPSYVNGPDVELIISLHNELAAIHVSIDGFMGDFEEKFEEDLLNYMSYKDKEFGGHYNSDSKKVYDANYFSNFKGSLVINLPMDASGSFSFGSFIFMSLHKDQPAGYNDNGVIRDGTYKETQEVYEDLLNHEYGHNLVMMDYGMASGALFNELPSLISFQTEGKLNEKYQDYTSGTGDKKTDNYYNQPWEIYADLYGGKAYSQKLGENDFVLAPATNEYVDKYETLKRMPISVQMKYMADNKDLIRGLELLNYDKKPFDFKPSLPQYPNNII